MPDIQSLLQLLQGGGQGGYQPGISGISAQPTPQGDTLSGLKPPQMLSGVPPGGDSGPMLGGAPGGGSSLSGTGLTGGPEGMSLEQLQQMMQLQGTPGPSTLGNLLGPIGQGGIGQGLGMTGGIGQQGLGFGQGGFNPQQGFLGQGDPSNAAPSPQGSQASGGFNPLSLAGYGSKAAQLLFGGQNKPAGTQGGTGDTGSQLGAQFPTDATGTQYPSGAVQTPYGTQMQGVPLPEESGSGAIPQAGGGSSLAPVEGGPSAGGQGMGTLVGPNGGGGMGGWLSGIGMNPSTIGLIASLAGGIGGATGANPDLLKALSGVGAGASLVGTGTNIASAAAPALGESGVNAAMGSGAGALTGAGAAAGASGIGSALTATDLITSLIAGATGGKGQSAVSSILEQIMEPSRSWRAFPGEVQQGWNTDLGLMQQLAKGTLGAQDPASLQAAVQAYNQGLVQHGGIGAGSPTWQGFNVGPQIQAYQQGQVDPKTGKGQFGNVPGGWSQETPYGEYFTGKTDVTGATPYSIPNLPDWGGGKIHGQNVGATNIFGPGSQALQQLIQARLASFPNLQATLGA